MLWDGIFQFHARAMTETFARLLDPFLQGRHQAIRGGSPRHTLSIFNRGESDNSAASKLFNVPDDLSKVFERDRTVAGIAKQDDRGRTVDVHALRHTFGTMLSKSGVSPRVAQAAMRHSSLERTMNVNADPRLLDVQGAVKSLPEFSVTNEPNENRQRIAAGAETLLPCSVTPAVTPTVTPAADFSSVLQSTPFTYSAFSPELHFPRNDRLFLTDVCGKRLTVEAVWNATATQHRNGSQGWPRYVVRRNGRNGSTTSAKRCMPTIGGGWCC